MVVVQARVKRRDRRGEGCSVPHIVAKQGVLLAIVRPGVFLPLPDRPPRCSPPRPWWSCACGPLASGSARKAQSWGMPPSGGSCPLRERRGRLQHARKHLLHKVRLAHMERGGAGPLAKQLTRGRTPLHGNTNTEVEARPFARLLPEARNQELNAGSSEATAQSLLDSVSAIPPDRLALQPSATMAAIDDAPPPPPIALDLPARHDPCKPQPAGVQGEHRETAHDFGRLALGERPGQGVLE